MKINVKKVLTICSIILSIAIVSIPCFNFTKLTNRGLLGELYREVPVTTEVGIFDSLVIADDEIAKDVVNGNKLAIKNRNGYQKEVKLYFLVTKNSTVPYNFLRLSLNENIFALNEIEPIEDDINYYFYLSDYQIDAYKEEIIESRLWLSKDTNNVDPKASLVANFVIK